jgi:hypothetical protein
VASFVVIEADVSAGTIDHQVINALLNVGQGEM